MSSSLRIALTVDPYVPVPPATYGGIERVIAGLIDQLSARGHEITLFAHPESRTVARHVPYGVPPHSGMRARATELWQLGSALWTRRRTFDIVHSFGRLAALAPVLVDRSLPKIQSYQRAIPWEGVARGARLSGDTLTFTACSDAMWHSTPRATHTRWVTIYNGVDVTRYTPVARVAADAPLMFLGRVERIKGAHTAIAIAKAAQRRLVIAGNRIDSDEGRSYFENKIEPHIDGDAVRYVGPVDDVAKNQLLGRAAALLMPIEWAEPFGIVMVEAMACGTPVMAFPRGSVPEVVEDGLTGVIVNSVDDAVRALPRVEQLDRTRIRTRCVERFSYPVIADAYERLYREGIARMSGGLPRAM